MFTSVTWSQFLSFAALVLALYYLAVLLTCYRPELRRRLATLLRRKATPGPDGIIGPVAADDIAYTSAVDLQVAPPEAIPAHGPATAAAPQGGPLGELLTLLQEAELLVAHTAATASSKEDFLSLLRLLVANSPALASSPYRQPAQQFLEAQCQGRLSFQVSPDDWQQLWTGTSN